MISGLLDESYDGMLQGHVGPAMKLLYSGLHEIRQRLLLSEWHELIETRCLVHPITGLIHQDPLTGGGYRAARQRQSNATLLDYIYYRIPVDMNNVSPIGRQIFRFTIQSTVAKAIRMRRAYTAHLLDEIASDIAIPRVLAIEPGHLREVELSSALGEGKAIDFVAFGSDQPALSRIVQTYGQDGVRTLFGSPRAVADGRETLARRGIGNVDLAYSPMLFNQLTNQQATKLTEQMWSVLKPGGYLLITNLLTDTVDTAFTECYSGWRSRYRTRADMVDLIRTIPISAIGGLTLDMDPDRAMAFLVLQRLR